MQQAVPNIEELFFAARELKSPGDRSAFLDRACSDPGARRRVEELLAVDPEANDFLIHTPADAVYSDGASSGSQTGGPQ